MDTLTPTSINISGIVGCCISVQNEDNIVPIPQVNLPVVLPKPGVRSLIHIQ